MQALNQAFKKVILLANQVLNTTTSGAAVDTYQDALKPSYETALVDVAIGSLGTQATTKVKIEESDDGTGFTGNTVAEGGEELTVAASTNYKMEIKRIKRYLRVVVTLTTPGATPSVGIYVGGLLWNAQKPFPAL